jgi:hypothetical protein
LRHPRSVDASFEWTGCARGAAASGSRTTSNISDWPWHHPLYAYSPEHTNLCLRLRWWLLLWWWPLLLRCSTLLRATVQTLDRALIVGERCFRQQSPGYVPGFLLIGAEPSSVRLWPLADMRPRPADVRFLCFRVKLFFKKNLGSQRQPQESTTECDKQKDAQDTTTQEQIHAFPCSRYFSHCYSRSATAGPKTSRMRAAEMRDSFVRSRCSRIGATSRVFAIAVSARRETAEL